MSGVTLTFNAQDALSKLWDAREEMMRPEPLLRSMGERLLEFHQQRFRDQTSPDGVKWKELSWRYKQRKRKNREQILTRDGYLRNTLRWQVNADELLFGTDRVYGAIHQFGGTIEIAARSQQAYYRQKKDGEIDNQFVRKNKSNFAQWHTIPAYKISIPARPWLGVSKAQGTTLIDMAKNYLQGAFN
ncbi:TPA: phage virion morphogenesis protein [Klebsiella pneumoniae]|uniref:Phage virion morphogenesis protein n=1 Tax=Klebsiella michiganensis TaxID=1134687 RepID=A0A7H5ABU6_9ENTR|nr:MULTISPECIES: phage virion morphogenesis protein [Klebsiella]RRF84680.1 phage virion morphogenesis protein [Klebsiella pneumoniae]DAK70589.1 MAG TPA: virion morphogenesis protein [Caudoviricetes sp.]HBN5449082.1 phage virion morphogenesis protein [Klebsiella oxytoca]EWF90815.1 phage virion morphogenesis protein [Klebsiella michiganensis]MBZ7492827.1 phage virion morphogenesis protein [Klebsiella michiganensis]